MSIDPANAASTTITDAAWNWSPAMMPRHRAPFPGLESIPANFSQAWQDMFVLTLLGGKRQGSYLEVGAHTPIQNNNTFLLSRQFGWRGASIELDPFHASDWQHYRPEDCLLIANALTLDYDDLLTTLFGSASHRIDYLQLDIDPSSNTLQVLKRLPLDRWRFNVITFETDAYTGDLRARQESRELLSQSGYTLWAPDVRVLFPPVSPDPIPFEDWWVASEILPELTSTFPPPPSNWNGLPHTLLLAP